MSHSSAHIDNVRTHLADAAAMLESERELLAFLRHTILRVQPQLREQSHCELCAITHAGGAVSSTVVISRAPIMSAMQYFLTYLQTSALDFQHLTMPTCQLKTGPRSISVVGLSQTTSRSAPLSTRFCMFSVYCAAAVATEISSELAAQGGELVSPDIHRRGRPDVTSPSSMVLVKHGVISNDDGGCAATLASAG